MALVYLLEQQPQPAFVVDKRCHLVAANHPGLAQLESDRGESLRQQLARVPTGGSQRLDTVELGDGESWYCVLAHPRLESEADTAPPDDRPA